MINFIEYIKQLWDTTSYVNPTRMNHMEDGIKGSSDAVVGLNEALDDVDALIGNTSISGIGDGTVTGAISAVNVNLTNTLTQFKTTLQSLKETNGFMLTRLPSGTVIGSHTLTSNMRGYFINDNGNGNGIIADYNLNTILMIGLSNNAWYVKNISKT